MGLNICLKIVVIEREYTIIQTSRTKFKVNFKHHNRFMNSAKGRYRGAIHCAVETARNEGPLAFYKVKV